MQPIEKTILKKTFPGLTIAFLLTFTLYTSLAKAENLESLRASGAIGESYNGYVIARQPQAQAEADAINAKRRAIYQEKATAQGINVDEVARVYATEIVKTVPAGTWIQINGQWKKK
ncbi:YdbL family protein [Nitrosomonas sp.]|uniref:YdbL family protein n=1 Tax=Nitrosomonas sp. TaxID=42353 RepID=UPI001D411E6C|nr:YdbL family protein [Nitrosomonas sp.]MBX3615715.1 YdbL family protein [Nitrosomonas sp.]